ncbi:MAG: 23S rRNA (uracil(1939)-C(5))-methyltransferase RlmD [Gammaproteobacteria bacterium]
MRAATDAIPEQVTIIDLSHDGRGVARCDGKTLFVDGGLTGETVEILRIRRRRHHDEGRVVNVLDAAADRVAPVCAHFGVCGGCTLQHLSADGQLEAKQKVLLENLERIGKVCPGSVFAPLSGPDSAYRRRARLGVRYVQKKGRVLVGFRERAKSFVADLDACPVLAKPAGDLIQPLAELIGSLTIRRRLAQVEVCIADNRCAFVLRVLDPPSDADLEQMRAFELAHDIDLYLQPKGPDSIRPLSESARDLHYRLPEFDLDFRFLPTDFIQVNAELNRKMVSRAMALLAPAPGQRIVDLFCGLGNFSLPIARLGAQVVGVEGDAALVRRARENARSNGLDSLAEFHVANLFEDCTGLGWLDQAADSVFLDPPRAGAQEILPAVARTGARRIVYVSCHPATLARDAGTLVNELGFDLRGAGVMDMFPHTAHVESIALFERS